MSKAMLWAGIAFLGYLSGAFAFAVGLGFVAVLVILIAERTMTPPTDPRRSQAVLRGSGRTRWFVGASTRVWGPIRTGVYRRMGR